jgi:hypothetical protein
MRVSACGYRVERALAMAEPDFVPISLVGKLRTPKKITKR